MVPSSIVVKFIKVLLQASVFLFLGTSFVVHAEQFGEKLYQQCAVCHGAQGEGIEVLNAPVIAGQNVAYLTRQLMHFSSGIRDKAEQAKPMTAIAKGLAKEDLDKLAAYVQAMPIPDVPTQNTLSGDLKNGSRYYQAKCGACHGGQAQGNKTFNAPRLAKQSSEYLLQQMQDFVAGKRGYDQQDKFGRQMAMMAGTTKGKELTDILFYISKQDMKQIAKH